MKKDLTKTDQEDQAVEDLERNLHPESTSATWKGEKCKNIIILVETHNLILVVHEEKAFICSHCSIQAHLRDRKSKRNASIEECVIPDFSLG
jgi:hypothetical protein